MLLNNLLPSSFLLAILHLVLTQNVMAQNPYPSGSYMSLEELKTKNPSLNVTLQVKERSGTEIKIKGGNLYKIEPRDKEVNKKEWEENIYAVSQGEDFYINCEKFDCNSEFAMAELFGPYIGIKAAASSNKSSIFSNDELLYALEVDKAELILLNNKNMSRILGAEPDLRSAYRKEPYSDQIETLMRYLTILNKRLSKN